MNAPELHALPMLVEVAHIHASPTNPRRHFDEEAHKEMTASVRQHGVLQPVLLRPWPKNGTIPRGMTISDTISATEGGRCFELVSGERRWRAAQSADVHSILAVVRDLSDTQVLETQLVENLQRQDVHPLEEAIGIERLMKAAELGVDEIADKVGKSKAYVYARLKLLALCPKAREAFYEGRLNASTALLIARIPHDDLQMKALVEITTPDWRGDAPSYRAAKAAVQAGYQLRLAEAPFPTGDAKLLPAAGSCAKCPKRSGNQTVLFDDEAGDLCLDPKCFADKKHAAYDRRKALAEKLGQKIVEGEEAKKLMPYGFSSGPLRDIGAVNPDTRCMDDPEKRTYREILGKDLPPVTVIIEDPRSHTFHEACDETAMAAALKKAGIHRPDPDEEDAEDRELEARQERERQQRAERIGIAERRRAALDTRVRLAIGADLIQWQAIPAALIRAAAAAMVTLDIDRDTEDLMRRYDFAIDDAVEVYEQVDAFCAHIQALPLDRLCMLLLDLTLSTDPKLTAWCDPDRDDMQPARLLALASAYGIDADDDKGAVLAEPDAPDQDDDQPPDDVLKIGDRVRIQDDLKSPQGRKRKCSGREGTVESIDGETIVVRTGPKAHELIANLAPHEVIRIADPAAQADVATKLCDQPAWPFPARKH